jgi:hypothetical protein
MIMIHHYAGLQEIGIRVLSTQQRGYQSLPTEAAVLARLQPMTYNFGKKMTTTPHLVHQFWLVVR